MNFAELLVLAIGLSMDAFAISICKGLSVEKLEKKHMVITGLWFGGSQMAMPVIGYFVGGSFYEAIQSVDTRYATDWSAIKGQIKGDLSNYLYKKTKRSPMILPVIMEV